MLIICVYVNMYMYVYWYIVPRLWRVRRWWPAQGSSAPRRSPRRGGCRPDLPACKKTYLSVCVYLCFVYVMYMFTLYMLQYILH